MFGVGIGPVFMECFLHKVRLLYGNSYYSPHAVWEQGSSGVNDLHGPIFPYVHDGWVCTQDVLQNCPSPFFRRVDLIIILLKCGAFPFFLQSKNFKNPFSTFLEVLFYAPSSFFIEM